MTKIINIETDKYTLAELLAIVRDGDEVIVQEANMPTARFSSLVEVPSRKERKPFVFGLFAGMGTVPDNFDDELPMEFWLGEDA